MKPENVSRRRARAAAGSLLPGLAALLIAGCGGGQTAPSGTTSPPAGPTTTTSGLVPTTALTNDPCFFGSWRSTVGTEQATIASGSVDVTGGGGTIISYQRDGSYSADFSKTLPYVGHSGGQVVALVVRGKTAGTFTAGAGALTLTDTSTTLTVITEVAGKVVDRVHPSPTSSSSYVCAGHRLTLSSGGFSTGYVPAA